MTRVTMLKSLIVIVLTASLNFNCSPSLSSLTSPTNLLGMLGNNPSLSSFSGLLNKVPSVGKLLGGKNPLTVLAPSNEAIAGLGQDALNTLTSSKNGLKDLGNLLKKHIIPGTVDTTGLASGTVKSVGGDPVSLGAAKLVGDPIKADNGMIQMIDQVLK